MFAEGVGIFKSHKLLPDAGIEIGSFQGIGELASYQENRIYVGIFDKFNDSAVFQRGGVAEFQHIAENGHLVIIIRVIIKLADSGGHACRVSVIGVNNQYILRCLSQLGAIIGWGKTAQSIQAILNIHHITLGHGYSGEEILEIVVAEEVRGIFIEIVKERHHWLMRVQFDRVRVEGCFVIIADGRGEHWILVIHVDQAVILLEEAIEFCFGIDNTLERTETLQVSLADISYEALVRESDIAEFADIAWVGSAHFDNGERVFFGKAEEGERHADLVIEIALSAEHVISEREGDIDKFLGGGFAVSACDSEERDIELLAVVASQLLEGLKDIIDQNQSIVIAEVIAVNDSVLAAAVKGTDSKIVAVEIGTSESEKDGAWFAEAAVCHDAFRGEEDFVEFFYSHCHKRYYFVMIK